MPKHSGCYVCGSTDDEILTSLPSPVPMAKGHSLALCTKCAALPRPELYAKVKTIQAAMEDAMKRAREAVARG